MSRREVLLSSKLLHDLVAEGPPSGWAWDSTPGDVLLIRSDSVTRSALAAPTTRSAAASVASYREATEFLRLKVLEPLGVPVSRSTNWGAPIEPSTGL